MPILAEYVKNREPDSPLWTNPYGTPLKYNRWLAIIDKVIRIAKKKDSRIVFPRGRKSHLIRHSRATFLAIHGWNEATLNKQFGWVEPDMAARHVEQARIDTGAAFDKMRGIERPGTRPKRIATEKPCPNPLCPEKVNDHQKYCPHCGTPIGTQDPAEELKHMIRQALDERLSELGINDLYQPEKNLIPIFAERTARTIDKEIAQDIADNNGIWDWWAKHPY